MGESCVGAHPRPHRFPACLAPGSPVCRWLYKEAVVQQVQELPEGGAAHVTVVITQAAYGRFQKLFPTDITSDPHTD